MTTKKTPAPAHLTPLELEIMHVLWEHGPATVQAVQEGLLPGRKLAYNSVQTMLNVLLRKQKVRRRLKSRAYTYAPAVTRRQAARHALGDLIRRMFGGSAESLVLSMVENRHLSSAELARLTALLEERQGGDHGER